jgi:hypothetical protein
VHKLRDGEALMRAQGKQRSFAAGEIAEEFWGHDDYRVFQTGLAKCQNFIVRPGGGLTRRPPTEFVTLAYDTSILIPMTIRSNDAFLIELGSGTARFFRNGGQLLNGTQVYEIAHPYLTTHFKRLRWQRSGDVLFMTHPTRGMHKLTRRGNVDWLSESFVFKNRPFLDENIDEEKTIRVNDVTGNVTLTAAGFAFTADMVGEQLRLRDGDQRVITAWVSGETGLAANALRSYNGRVYQVVSGTDAGPNPPVHDNGTRKSGAGKVVWKFIREDFGIVQITAVTNSTTATGSVKVRLPEEFCSDFDTDYGGAGLAKSWRWSMQAFSAGNGWPDNIWIHQGRLYLSQGPRFWFSESADFTSFKLGSTPQRAGNELLGSSSGSAEDVMWGMSGKTLLIGTPGEEYSVQAASASEAISPANLRIADATSDGSSAVQPVKANGAVLHVSADGTSLWEILYNFQINDFDSDNRAEPSFHLPAFGIRKLAWQRDPARVLWMITAGGRLCGHTYNRKQEVFAWHGHPVDGMVIEDICVVQNADNGNDDVWLRVRRTYCGKEQVMIERMLKGFMRSRDTDPTLQPYLDCQRVYVGQNIRRATGLDHLIGGTVQAVSNMGYEGEFEVCQDGCIEFDHDGICRLVVGVPYLSRAQSLPGYTALQDGSSEGRMRTVKALQLRALGVAMVYCGDYAGDHDLAEDLFPGSPDVEGKIVLRTPDETTLITTDWDGRGQVDVWTAGPFPLDITGWDAVTEFGEH